jgi:hypothetical protein
MTFLFEPTLEELCQPSPARQSSAFSLAPPLPFDVYDVHLTENPHRFAARQRPSAAQKAGLRYEKRVKAFLSSRLASFVDGPWLSYRRLSDHQRKFCQPDGYMYDQSVLTIFEIKYHWCAEAATQLRLYRAVLGHLLSPRECQCMCVARSFDPSVIFEGRAHFIDDLEPSRRDSAPNVINVLIWK